MPITPAGSDDHIDDGAPPAGMGNGGGSGGRRSGGGGRGGPATATAEHMKAFDKLIVADVHRKTRMLRDPLVLAVLDAFINDPSEADWAQAQLDSLAGGMLLTKNEVGTIIHSLYPRLRGKDYEAVLAQVLEAAPQDEKAAKAATKVAYRQVRGRWRSLPWWTNLFTWPISLIVFVFTNMRAIFGFVLVMFALGYLGLLGFQWFGSADLKEKFLGPKGVFHKAAPDALNQGRDAVERILPGAGEGLTPMPPINTTPRAASGLYSPEQWEIPGYNLGQGGAGYSEPSLPPQPYQPSGGGTTISKPGDVSKLPR